MDTTQTQFSNKCDILAEIWMNYRGDENFEDFIEYNDLGLPLAYAIANNVIKSTEMSQKLIEETFDLLLAGLETDDTGFETLEEVLAVSEK